MHCSNEDIENKMTIVYSYTRLKLPTQPVNKVYNCSQQGLRLFQKGYNHKPITGESMQAFIYLQNSYGKWTV